MLTTILKKCSKCSLTLPLSEFPWDGSAQRRLRTYCKSCHRQSVKEWRIKNKPHLARKQAERRKKYPTENADAVRRWRQNNPDVSRRMIRNYQREHPELVSVWQARRRALRRSAGRSFTLNEWEVLKQKFGYRCLACKKTEPFVHLVADHIVPLSRGGRGNIHNIQPLCLECNSRKHTDSTDYRPSFYNLDHDVETQATI